jgi:hypothetical protein
LRRGYAYRTTPTDVGLGRALVLRCAWRKGKQDGVFRQLRLLGPRLRGCWPRRSLRLRYVRPAGVQKSTCSEGDACRECSFRDVLTGAGQDCGCHEISCGLAGPWQSRLAVGWLHVEPLHTSVGIFLHFKHPCANYFLLPNGVGRPCLEVRRCDSQKHPVAIFRCRGALVRTAYEACLRYLLSTNSSASVKPPETRTGTPFGPGEVPVGALGVLGPRRRTHDWTCRTCDQPVYGSPLSARAR